MKFTTQYGKLVMIDFSDIDDLLGFKLNWRSAYWALHMHLTGELIFRWTEPIIFLLTEATRLIFIWLSWYIVNKFYSNKSGKDDRHFILISYILMFSSCALYSGLLSSYFLFSAKKVNNTSQPNLIVIFETEMKTE